MDFNLIPSESQSCSAALKRLFAGEQLFYCDQIYRAALDAGLRNEWFSREEGVSFNPRPARLLQLGIEAGYISTTALQAVIDGAIALDTTENSVPYTSALAPSLLDWLRHYHITQQHPHPDKTADAIGLYHKQVLGYYALIQTDSTLPKSFQAKLLSACNRYL